MGKLLSLFTILIIVFTFSSKAFASNIPYVITTGIPPTSVARGSIYFTTQYKLNYQSGKIFLSLNPDGTGNTMVDDSIEIVVTNPDGKIKSFNYSYPSMNCSSLNSLAPADITDIFAPGENSVKVVLRDICGGGASSNPLYLVNINAPDPTPTPSPAPSPLSKTPLILIPGIGGSELKVNEDTFWSKDDGHGGIFNHAYAKDEKIWVNEGEAAKLGEDDYFDVLKMKSDGINSEANIELTGNIYSGAYQETINFFESNGYTLDKDFFVFPYDWRKDIALTAILLDTKINEIKSQTGSTKVDIIAHSMGGLVARNYIQDAPRAQNVRKLFTLGTPHLGTPYFIKALRYGVQLEPVLLLGLVKLEPSAVKDVIQNMLGGFELATSQAYFNFYSGHDNSHPLPYADLRDVDNNGVTGALNYDQTKTFLSNLGHNTSLFTTSETFHSLDNKLSNTNGVELINIVGSGKPTLGQIIEKYLVNFAGIKIPQTDEVFINGDETVPLLSASFGSANIYYTNQKHGGLVLLGPALNLAKNVLNGDNNLPNGISNQPYTLKGTGLSVHSPVSIHVYDSNGNHTGPTSDGFEVDIPESSYDTLGNAKFIFLPEDGVYTIKFEATGQGSFDFKIRKFENNENTKTYLYKEILLTSQTKAETTIDTKSPQPPTLKLDKNGDGTLDSQIIHFSTLYGGANYDFTSPTISLEIDPKSIWPPDGKMIDVKIKAITIDENPYLITIIVDDEYDLIEPAFTVENQPEFDKTIKLEATRRGDDSDGRIYVIKILATDLAGNTSIATKEVIVPHDLNKEK